MSNIAIILGTIPMALGIGESLAEMRQPMGIVVAGGIVSSMIMTLWLIPCLEFALSKRVKVDNGTIDAEVITEDVTTENTELNGGEQ